MKDFYGLRANDVVYIKHYNSNYQSGLADRIGVVQLPSRLTGSSCKRIKIGDDLYNYIICMADEIEKIGEL